MKILIKPKEYKCQNYWHSKREGVILVEKEEDIDKIFKLLVKQDDYWESYKHLIKVAPKEIESESTLALMCEYCGKTDIDNIDEIKKKVPFMIYQYVNEG